MTIPILDLAPQIARFRDQYLDAFERVLDSNRFINGPEVQAFEQEAAAYLGTEYAVGVNSGTDALVIGLRALGVQPGDEVICPSFTFFATAEAIGHCGATPVFVDIDPVSFGITPEAVSGAITSRTSAIIPVHLFGLPVDMEGIMALAADHGLSVLEDVAQGWGSSVGGRKAGSIGHAGAFSFFPSKNLGAFGDGGLIATNDANVADLAMKLRAHGGSDKYANEMLGYNSRLDAVQAAMLRVTLRHIDELNTARRDVARRYDQALGKEALLTTPNSTSGRFHVYHQYTVRVAGGLRDAMKQHLDGEGIQTMVYYPNPIHRLPVFAGKWDLPETDRAAAEVLSLPMGPGLTEPDQLRVIEAIRRALVEVARAQ